MTDEHICRDIEHLARGFIHRGSGTEHEHAAARYIYERFREYTSDCNIEEFGSIDSFRRLFASYYGEFIIICLVAYWLPQFAFIYGAIVLITYLAEFTGYRIMSRFLPHYETQNVIARFLAPRPKRLFIVVANYDTPRETPLSHPAIAPRLHIFHLLAVVSMMIITITCALESAGIFNQSQNRYDLLIRAIALAYLIFIAAVLLYSEKIGEFTHGANGNASGVAVLLSLAERFKEERFEETDLWMVATGSKETWLSGMIHFIRSHKFDKDNTYIINIDHVGNGELKYVKGEGMMHVYKCSPKMRTIAKSIAGEYGATEHAHRGMPSDALIPLTRGLNTIGITAVESNGVPANWQSESDTVGNIDYEVIYRALDFTNVFLHELDDSLTHSES